MGHEISQYDIPDRILRATNPQSRVGMRKEMGDAKITHTIFGRAKIRVIREEDKTRRVWMLAVLAMMFVAVVVWQGWIALHLSELLQKASSISSTEPVQVSAPSFLPEYKPSTGARSAGNRQTTPSLVETYNLTTRREPPPPTLGLKASQKMVTNPAESQPLAEAQPQSVSPAPNNNTSANQAEKQQPPKLSGSNQVVVPAVSTSSAAQPLTNKPGTGGPLVVPASPKPSPAGDIQQPVGAQP